MVALFFQSMLEWLFRHTYVTFEFFMVAGFLAALSRVDTDMKKEKKKKMQLLMRVFYMMRLQKKPVIRSRR